ncbi:MAG TPA: hypothetical protein VLL08_20765 [Kineosporiaceae bacterium]|nr:hypothetical protein [Kineosporiaceae bacterium]
MDVSAVTGQVTLLPESSGEVLVDVVNTEGVIDALDVDLGGIPGASVRIDSATPTLFPGERRRLTLRVELPSQVPAGRHRAELVVLGVATGLRRSVDLDVDVPPQPALAAGAHPAVRRAWHRVDFPVTVANRGNTPLHVLVRDLDVPDTVTVEFEPAEFDVAAWSSGVCRARVTGPRRLTGGDQDHVVDLSVTARSTTPGRPLLESEISQDTRVTFRQRPALSPGVLLAGALVTIAVLWLIGGFFGLRMFVRLVDPGTEPAASFFPSATAPAYPDAAITVSGRMVSAVDGSPVAAVTVLACSRETEPTTQATQAAPTPPTAPTRSAACTEKTATASTVSDGSGHFWLPNLFPGPYQLTLTGKGLKARTAPVRWFEASCSLNESISAPHGVLTVAVVYPLVTGAVGPVTVTVHQATASPSEAADPSPSASPAPSASGSASPVMIASAPPCAEAATGPAPATNGASASPAAVESAWPTVVTAADGTEERTAIVVLKKLPAPARYDLTIDAGAGLTLTVHEVHLNADQKHPVINVTLHPSASASPSTP